MPEVIVRYSGEKALEALRELTKIFDISIETTVDHPATHNRRLPISFAQKPDLTALAGLWDGREITLDDLRKEAWGERF